jgi:putative addiction module component (TIGR02574 family)
MSVELDRLKEQAAKLSDAERAELALSLIESLEAPPIDSPEDVERAWDAEIQRRIGEIERGEARLISGDEAFARLRERLG